MRIAVVTPYFQEDRKTLERCIDSVMAQSVPVDHVLVADGHPQDWVETYDHVEHLVLSKSSADFGDTPRTIGFLLAMRRDYDIIQFLDADNILYKGHFEAVVKGFSAVGADILIARRHMLRPDGSIIDIKIEEDEKLRHVDTNCYVFSRTAFSMGLRWSHIPRELSFIDDRVFFSCLKNAKLKIGVLPDKTVGYTCMWPDVYRNVGEQPPPGHRSSMKDHYARANIWWANLEEEQRRLIQKNLGTRISLGR